MVAFAPTEDRITRALGIQDCQQHLIRNTALITRTDAAEIFVDPKDVAPRAHKDAFRVRLCTPGKPKDKEPALSPFFVCEIGVKNHDRDMSARDMYERFLLILNKEPEATALLDRPGVVLAVHYAKEESFVRHVAMKGMDPPGHPDRPTFTRGDPTGMKFPPKSVAVDIYFAGCHAFGGFVNYMGE